MFPRAGNWRLHLARLLVAALPLLMPATAARADVWEWLTSALQDDASPAEMELPPGAIGTGPNETRILQFGRDVVKLYPRSVIRLEIAGKETRIDVINGTIGVKVAPRKVPSFSVHTQYLIAVVKGTEFDVSVTAGAAAVSVTKGRVAVKAVGVIGGVDVTPGKTATASADGKGPKTGKTPRGGAQAAATAAAPARSKPGKTPGPTDGDGDRQRDVTPASRTGGNPPGPGNAGKPSDGGGESGEGGEGEDGEGEDGEGEESGEGGDGEGGEGGDDD